MGHSLGQTVPYWAKQALPAASSCSVGWSDLQGFRCSVRHKRPALQAGGRRFDPGWLHRRDARFHEGFNVSTGLAATGCVPRLCSVRASESVSSMGVSLCKTARARPRASSSPGGSQMPLGIARPAPGPEECQDGPRGHAGSRRLGREPAADLARRGCAACLWNRRRPRRRFRSGNARCCV